MFPKNFSIRKEAEKQMSGQILGGFTIENHFNAVKNNADI